MAKKDLSIPGRLRAHPDIVVRRAPAMIWAGVALAAVIVVVWIFMIVNAAALTAEFAELQEGSVTLNQRIGSRFGVLIGVIFLPILALLVFFTFFFLSQRYYRRATGTRLRRTYKGAFASPIGAGGVFQEQLRTRDPAVLGTMNESSDKGNLVIEGWSAAADAVAYVAVFEFSNSVDPGWELVEFAGPDFASYQRVFRSMP